MKTGSIHNRKCRSLKCMNCGKSFRAPKFCSKKCAAKSQRDVLKSEVHGNDTYIIFRNGIIVLVNTKDFRHVGDLEVGIRLTKGGERHYARAGSGKKRILLHQLILGKPPRGFHIDHRNGNPLDNRRENLRIATWSQNAWNQRKTSKPRTSKYKGVYKVAKRNRGGILTDRWAATITCFGKNRWLGYFHTEMDAARAYDEAARELFTEFAWLNFPDECVAPPELKIATECEQCRGAIPDPKRGKFLCSQRCAQARHRARVLDRQKVQNSQDAAGSESPEPTGDKELDAMNRNIFP